MSDTEDFEPEPTGDSKQSNLVTPEKIEKKRKSMDPSGDTNHNNTITPENIEKKRKSMDGKETINDYDGGTLVNTEVKKDDTIQLAPTCDDSDDSFSIDISQYKKERNDSSQQDISSRTTFVRVTEKFYDKNGKECIFLVMKFNYWALKSNIMKSAITTLFTHALKGKTDVKQLFGGCWSVEERHEPYSISSEIKVTKGTYPQYVLLMKVIVEKYTIESAVNIVTENIRRFMKSKSFPECYKLSFTDDMKNKLYNLVKEPNHEIYKISKQMDFKKTYSDTLDCLVHDDAIYRIFMLETNKTKRELLACGMCAKIMFKNPTVKQA